MVLEFKYKKLKILSHNQFKKLISANRRRPDRMIKTAKEEYKIIKHPDFELPGRQVLLKAPMGYKVIPIEAEQTLIKRPKNKNINN